MLDWAKAAFAALIASPSREGGFRTRSSGDYIAVRTVPRTVLRTTDITREQRYQQQPERNNAEGKSVCGRDAKQQAPQQSG